MAVTREAEPNETVAIKMGINLEGADREIQGGDRLCPTLDLLRLPASGLRADRPALQMEADHILGIMLCR